MHEVANRALSFTGLSKNNYRSFWSDDITDLADKLGGVNPAIEEHLMNRCCSVPDVAGANGEIAEARFPELCSQKLQLRIDWDNWSGRMGITKRTFEEQFDRALKDWMEHVNLKWHLTTSRAAHCTVDFGHLDGNTLAWSHLANNTCGKGFQQRYDIRSWTSHYLYLVALHELGHLLGLPHNRGNYIMNPYMIRGLDGLTQNDVDRAVRLGYGPAERPDPEPPVPGTTVKINDSPVLVGGKQVGVLRFIPDASTPDLGDDDPWGDV